MWTSFRPNLWLPKRSTARRCTTWRASQRRSTPSDVPSPWAPGSRELEQKATAAATTSPTSSWSRTVCRVSATPTRRWAVTRVIEPRYHFFVFVEPFACVCLQAHIPVCVCVSVVSVSIDEEGSHSSSEEEADSHSTSSPQATSSSPSTSASTPVDMPQPYSSSLLHTPSSSSYLSSCPSSSSILSSSCPTGVLELASPSGSHSPDSVCSSGHASPLLGPRSQCSGASSPDCDQERGVCPTEHWTWARFLTNKSKSNDWGIILAEDVTRLK